MKKKNNLIKIIAILIDIATILFAFIAWSKLPNIIPAHYNSLMQPDRYGNKMEYVIILLIPILGMIPWKGNRKEYHCTDEETLKKAAEEQKNNKYYPTNNFNYFLYFCLGYVTNCCKCKISDRSTDMSQNS